MNSMIRQQWDSKGYYEVGESFCFSGLWAARLSVGLIQFKLKLKKGGFTQSVALGDVYNFLL